jgi:hypothetical protein
LPLLAPTQRPSIRTLTTALSPSVRLRLALAQSTHRPRSSIKYTSALPASGCGVGCWIESCLASNVISFGPQAASAARAALGPWARAEAAKTTRRDRLSWSSSAQGALLEGRRRLLLVGQSGAEPASRRITRTAALRCSDSSSFRKTASMLDSDHRQDLAGQIPRCPNGVTLPKYLRYDSIPQRRQGFS